VSSGLEHLISYEFRRHEILEEALTHGSAGKRADKGSRNYNRLEFLGDRVLGLIISEWLIKKFPLVNEGVLALRYNFLVQRDTLVNVARGIELGEYIRMSRSEEAAGGRDKPAILADCCEAVIGAIFMDGGLDAARRFIDTNWGYLYAQSADIAKDNKTALQEWAQGRGFAPPEYEIIDRKGPAHAITFTVKASLGDGSSMTGIGPSRRSAEQDAAGTLLKAMMV
tara:strand:- start:670 stop:1344 length:675 start_codon:yes stop_codon:yes gene_type:complete